MALPFEPPIKPMLAKLAPEIPVGEGWLYEPKWDGFRAIVFRDEDRVEITSRNTKPLTRYFPELVEPLKAALPSRAIVDGEIIIAVEGGGLDFDALLLRIHPAASRVNLLADESPSSFVAFDMLAVQDADMRAEPLVDRFKSLREATTVSNQVFLTPQTDEPDLARDWFVRFEGAGLDGIVAKRFDQRYLSDQRAMLKIKHQRTADCVAGGYRMSKDGKGVGSILLGLYSGEQLHYVGHTSSFTTSDKRAMLPLFEAMRAESGFGGRSPGGPSRWAAAEDRDWVQIAPKLVCEVAFDHMQGERFRHGTTFVRWRPDKDPRDCTWEQLEPPNPFDLAEIRDLSR